MGVIHWKLRSRTHGESISFEGSRISAGEFKRLIAMRLNLCLSYEANKRSARKREVIAINLSLVDTFDESDDFGNIIHRCSNTSIYNDDVMIVSSSSVIASILPDYVARSPPPPLLGIQAPPSSPI
jgi:hypothetical protein